VEDLAKNFHPQQKALTLPAYLYQHLINMISKPAHILAEHVSVEHDDESILYDISLDIQPCTITALMGPENCGKSTLLRLINRMNDDRDGFWMHGNIYVNEVDIYADDYSVEDLRRRVAMITDKPALFKDSIWSNAALGLNLHGIKRKSEVEPLIEAALREVNLWDSVKDKLNKMAQTLDNGEQQRLCLARALALQPIALLLDMPTSSLDPFSTTEIEQIMFNLKDKMTIVFSTQNIQQAGRISDNTAFLFNGELLEYAPTRDIFTNPQHELTQKYLTGRFG